MCACSGLAMFFTALNCQHTVPFAVLRCTTTRPLPLGSPLTPASLTPFSFADTTGLIDCPEASATMGSASATSAEARTIRMVPPLSRRNGFIRPRKPCGRLKPTYGSQRIGDCSPGGGGVPEPEGEADHADRRDRGRDRRGDGAQRERPAVARGHDRHGDSGEERENDERSNGERLRRDRGEQEDTDPGASTHPVDEADSERTGWGADRVAMGTIRVWVRMEVEVAMAPTDEQPEREEDDQRADGGLGALVEALGEVAAGDK